jgi:beta-galactosidase
VPTKVFEPDGDWRTLSPEEMPLLIVPAMQMVDEQFAEKLSRYARAGGHLLITARSGWMDRTGQLWEGPLAMPLLSLMGATIEGYDSLPEETFATVKIGERSFKWSVWGELLKPKEGTRVLARYTDQFYAGTAAVTQRGHGRGTVSYCGVWAEPAFDEMIIEKLATQAGLQVTILPPNVHVLHREGRSIVVNYQDKSIEAPASADAQFLIGGRTVPPAGVAVWRG